jgi:hypothetical protein
MIANLLVVGGIVLALYGAYTLWESKQVSVTDADLIVYGALSYVLMESSLIGLTMAVLGIAGNINFLF